MEERTNIDILYEIAIERLDAQIKRIDGVDNKIGVTFGLTNAIVAALVAFIVLLPPPVPRLVSILATLSACSYLVTLIFLFFAYRSRGWSFRPDIKRLREICTDPKYHDYPHLVKEWIANQCVRSLEWNSQPLVNKVLLSNNTLYPLSAQGLFLVASFICYLFN